MRRRRRNFISKHHHPHHRVVVTPKMVRLGKYADDAHLLALETTLLADNLKCTCTEEETELRLQLSVIALKVVQSKSGDPQKYQSKKKIHSQATTRRTWIERWMTITSKALCYLQQLLRPKVSVRLLAELSQVQLGKNLSLIRFRSFVVLITIIN